MRSRATEKVGDAIVTTRSGQPRPPRRLMRRDVRSASRLQYRSRIDEGRRTVLVPHTPKSDPLIADADESAKREEVTGTSARVKMSRSGSFLRA